MPAIIVGLDGSRHSRPALEWAMREAVQRHVPLIVMTVHPNPVRPATRIYWAVPDLAESFDPELARKRAQELVDEVASDIGGPPPEVIVKVLTGDPVTELVAASRDAEMLVLGSHHHGLAKLLIGSVDSQVLHHAGCPVVVVPGAQPAS